MPVYTYACKTCGDLRDSFNSIANRHNAPICACNGDMVLSIQPTQIAPVLGGGDFQGYQCPVTDKWVTSRKERSEIMKRHNLVDVGDRGSTKGLQASGLPSK